MGLILAFLLDFDYSSCVFYFVSYLLQGFGLVFGWILGGHFVFYVIFSGSPGCVLMCLHRRTGILNWDWAYEFGISTLVICERTRIRVAIALFNNPSGQPIPSELDCRGQPRHLHFSASFIIPPSPLSSNFL